VPQRGDKRSLLETVARNAGESLARHKLRRAGDLTTRSKALDEIAEALGMETAPLRIECFDVSQIQGTDVVASMVVFEDGLARKSEYRRFAVRGNPDGSGTDDLAAMSEVMRRRFARYRAEAAPGGSSSASSSAAEPAAVGLTGGASGAADGPAAGADEFVAGAGAGGDDDSQPVTHELPGIDPLTGRPRRFAYPPNLVVVDGGQPQVNAVAAVLSDLGITDVALCGLAKRLEEVWLPGEDFPVILPRTSEALYLLQRVRDEAHRFAITFHRQRRSKRMTASALDNIPGLGETRRKALLRHFGSLKRLSQATPEEIAEVPGIGRRTAEAVLAALTEATATPGPDTRPTPPSPTATPSSGDQASTGDISATPAKGVPADAAEGVRAGSAQGATAGSAEDAGAASAGGSDAFPVGGAGKTKPGANRNRVLRPVVPQVVTSPAEETDPDRPGTDVAAGSNTSDSSP
jgi:excinuclease ABC subunit C